MKIIKNTILVLCSLCFALSAFAEKKMNVIVVNFDDLGAAWLSPYAKNLKLDDLSPFTSALFAKHSKHFRENPQIAIDVARETSPFIDKLASAGMTFNTCYATSNLCSSSRVGLLTSSYQERWGVCDLRSAVIEGIDPAKIKIMPYYFKQAGYNCASIGKWHVSLHDEAYLKKWNDAKVKFKDTNFEVESFKVKGFDKEIKIDNELESARLLYISSWKEGQRPSDMGFDYYYGYNSAESRYYCAPDLWDNGEPLPMRPRDEFLTDLLTNKTIEYIEKSVKEEKPFMIYYAPMTVHERLDPAPEKYSAQYLKYGQSFALHAGNIRAVDDGLRRIHETLESLEQANNTIIIITSDNGSPFGIPPANAPFAGSKGTYFMGGSRVPLIVYIPTINPKLKYSDALVSTMDIFPTVMEAAKIKLPDNIDGESLLPIIKEESKDAKRSEFFQLGLHGCTWSIVPIIGNQDDEGYAPMFAFSVNKEGKVALARTATPAGKYKNLIDGLPSSIEFYNLENDKHQTKDIASENSANTKEMAKSINAWLNTLQTPLEHSKTTHKAEFFKELKNITSK